MDDNAEPYDSKVAQAHNIARVQAELTQAAAKDEARAKRLRERTKAQRDELLISLIRARQAQHLTQIDLANKLGMQQSTIARIESGKGNPGLNTLLAIAAALDVNIVLE